MKTKNYFESQEWKATTDPGIFWLENPSNIEGTAILFPGQYKDAYKLDLHNGNYLALCQRSGSVKVWRDNNKNRKFDPDKTEKGMFGINIHKAGSDSTQVNKWSAGCQVFQKEDDFDKFILLCQGHQALYGNKFTYTLINEVDLIKVEARGLA